MAEDDTKEEVKSSASLTDAAIVQIREVVKWLIAAFAAVGVALAAGSQLSEIGHLSGWRLVAAGLGIFLVLVGVALAILKAVRVLTPEPISLKELAESSDHSGVRQKVESDPTLLLGHGESVIDIQDERNRQYQEETAAWKKFEADETDKEALRAAERASANRLETDKAVGWLLEFARYSEISQLFNRSLKWMTGAAAVAAVGIGLFAWAAHPEDKSDETPAPVVAKAPVEVEIDLSDDGKQDLADELGPKCDGDKLAAVAVGGTADALEVVTVPGEDCSLERFTLTDTLGTYESTEPVIPVKPNPLPPVR
jgi:hypothetical protein